MKKLDNQMFQDKVVQNSKPVLVDFNAAWCGPCKKLSPILKDLSGVYEGRIEFYEVDAGENPGIAQQFGVMSLPTIIFFKDGKESHRLVGLASKDKIIEKLNALI